MHTYTTFPEPQQPSPFKQQPDPIAAAAHQLFHSRKLGQKLEASKSYRQQETWEGARKRDEVPKTHCITKEGELLKNISNRSFGEILSFRHITKS